MAVFGVCKPLVAASIIAAVISFFALGVLVVSPILSSSQPTAYRGILIPRYGSIPLDGFSKGVDELDGSSTGAEEKDGIEESGDWQRKR
jgi:hypothetical protein